MVSEKIDVHFSRGEPEFPGRGGRENFARLAGGKVPAGERGAPDRRARETLARLAKSEHIFSRKLKSIGRRFTYHVKARRARILVSVTEIPNRTYFPIYVVLVESDFLSYSPECGLDELSYDV